MKATSTTEDIHVVRNSWAGYSVQLRDFFATVYFCISSVFCGLRSKMRLLKTVGNLITFRLCAPSSEILKCCILYNGKISKISMERFGHKQHIQTRLSLVIYYSNVLFIVKQSKNKLLNIKYTANWQ